MVQGQGNCFGGKMKPSIPLVWAEEELMVGKSLAKRYGANGGRGRMGQTGHEKKKGDGVAGTGWERCFAATEMERKRCYVSSGTQGAHVWSSRVQGVQRLCLQSSGQGVASCPSWCCFKISKM